MQNRPSRQAIIERLRVQRILSRFTKDTEPELIHFVSGVNAPPDSAIDDGSDHYGDLTHDTRPAWTKKDLDGWR